MTPDSLAQFDKPELIALVLALAEQNRLLREQVAVLHARVAEREARLEIPPKTPDNSSLPPSKGEKANRPEKVEKRRKGRPGVARELCPNPDHVRDVYAESCEGCGYRPSPDEQSNVHAYDHVDLPPIKPVVTRVNLHSGICRCCGKRIAATAPEDMPLGSPFGLGPCAVAHEARHAPFGPDGPGSRWWSICTPGTWSVSTASSRC